MLCLRRSLALSMTSYDLSHTNEAIYAQGLLAVAPWRLIMSSN